MADSDAPSRVVIVGGGFAGVACAKRLAEHDDFHVTLVDRHNYHQFQPLLYQVATSQLAPSDIAYSLRKLFADDENVELKLADVASIDPASRTVVSSDGVSWTGDALVVAAGSQPNFFGTSGADEHALPLYSLDDAVELRSRIIGVFVDADRDPTLDERGALNFVVVGGGPTGVEVAGALADMIHETMSTEYHDLAVTAAQVHLVDAGPSLLGPFSDRAHDYVSKVLHRAGVRMHLGVTVTEVGPGHVSLADGTTIPTATVVWGGGIKGPAVAASSGLPLARGGRIDIAPDLSVPGFDRVWAIGDIANVPGPAGGVLPQLGSVAQQSGRWAADNIRATFAGDAPKPFHYKDKGIMAMIGRGSAIAEVGPHRHELHGVIAFSAWLGVHAMLMTGVRNRVDAFINWGWDYFSKDRGPQVLDRSDAARIAWDDDEEDTPLVTAGHDGGNPAP
jgi:NADH dehydrogenase